MSLAKSAARAVEVGKDHAQLILVAAGAAAGLIYVGKLVENIYAEQKLLSTQQALNKEIAKKDQELGDQKLRHELSDSFLTYGVAQEMLNYRRTVSPEGRMTKMDTERWGAVTGSQALDPPSTNSAGDT